MKELYVIFSKFEKYYDYLVVVVHKKDIVFTAFTNELTDDDGEAFARFYSRHIDRTEFKLIGSSEIGSSILSKIYDFKKFAEKFAITELSLRACAVIYFNLMKPVCPFFDGSGNVSYIFENYKKEYKALVEEIPFMLDDIVKSDFYRIADKYFENRELSPEEKVIAGKRASYAGNPEKAKVLYTEAMESKDKETVASAKYLYAQLLLQYGTVEMARDAVKDALKLAGPDRRLSLMGHYCVKKEDYAGALLFYKELLDYGNKFKDKKTQRVALLNISVCERHLGKNESALTNSQNAVSLIDDLVSYCQVTHELAAAKKKKGDISEADESFKNLIDTSKKTGYTVGKLQGFFGVTPKNSNDKSNNLRQLRYSGLVSFVRQALSSKDPSK